MSKPYTYDAAERQRQLDRLRDMKDEDIDTSDPDAHVIREDQLASARPFQETLRARKKPVTLHVDADVLDWYQRQGEGYQTRMNRALRSQMEAEQKTAPSR
jgi:uncharacterized protein (DUF4415 family)